MPNQDICSTRQGINNWGFSTTSRIMTDGMVKKAKTGEKNHCLSENLSGNAVATIASLQELRDQVFSNDLVWWNLGQFLSLSDLKDCRLVSRAFNRKVLDSTDFKIRSVVKLCEEDLCADGFGKTQERWKNLSFPILQSMSDDICLRNRNMMDFLNGAEFLDLLNKVEFLELRHERPYELPSCVIRIVEAPAKLQSLSVDLVLLGLRGGENFLRTCQSVLQNIRELKFGPKGRGIENVVRLVKRLHELASCVTNLNVLKMHEDCLKFWDEGSTMPIVLLVERNRLHLQTLELSCNQWGNIESSLINNGVHFPVLKKLKIEARNIIPKRLGEFLEAHPSLQNLHMMFTGEVDQKLNVTVSLTSLLAEVRKKGERLKKLQISTPSISSSFASADTVNALLSLTRLKLESFELDGSDMSSAHLASFLSNLSSTIRCVTFHISGFQMPDTILTSSHFTNIDPLKLVVLCLRGRDSGVTDETAEFICRNLKMLQKLDLSFSSCTDYGFTGMKPGSTASSEFSLTNLRGLKSLTLKSCPNITDQTLILGIQFTELAQLNLDDNFEFTAQACLQVLRQNPSLEKFTFGLRLRERNKLPPFDEIRVIAPRLKGFHLYPDYDEDDEDEDVVSYNGVVFDEEGEEYDIDGGVLEQDEDDGNESGEDVGDN